MHEQNVGPTPPTVRFEMEAVLAGARSTWPFVDSEIMTGRNMQTLTMIALVAAALTVVVFEVRELFTGWYSETLPSLTWSNYAIGGVQIALCTLVAILTLFRIAFRT